jgi:anaerobic ribonucleoside-triphosphate reductase activating protein
MGKQVRLSGIAYESLVNGPGMRRVFFAQGCKHNCEGCFNPDTHDFQGGEDRNMDELINEVKDNPILKGVTFSGGDPFEKAEEFAYMAKNFKIEGLNIWSYTGYTFEFIMNSLDSRPEWGEFLKYIDILVDGRFEQDKKDETLRYRGSSNQRIIDVQESISTGLVVVLHE